MDDYQSIPHTFIKRPLVDKDSKLKACKEFLNLIIEYIDPYKLAKYNTDSLLEAISKNPDTKISLESLEEKLQCLVCQKTLVEIVTSCGHGYCKPCLNYHISSQTMNKIILNSNESVNGICTSCRFCDYQFTLEDLEQLYPNIQELKINAAQRKIEDDLKINQTFTCLTCKEARGSKMLIKYPCYHMCKVCVQNLVLEENITKCITCKLSFNYQELANETFKCTKCKSSSYFIGDNMQELFPGYVYCISCSIEVIDNTASEGSPRSVVSMSTKKKVVQNIFKCCDFCHEEKWSIYIFRHMCCKKVICYNCISVSSQCLGCNKTLNENQRKRIEDHMIKENSN